MLKKHIFLPQNSNIVVFFIKMFDFLFLFNYILICRWGYSSVGRAFEWHSKGQRFDPAYLHQFFKTAL